MDLPLDHAFRTLGLAPGATKKQVRRAYLKLLKVHKPEQDPEGFQRIRAAYERIDSAPKWELKQFDPDPTASPLPHGPTDQTSAPNEAPFNAAQSASEHSEHFQSEQSESQHSELNLAPGSPSPDDDDGLGDDGFGDQGFGDQGFGDDRFGDDRFGDDSFDDEWLDQPPSSLDDHFTRWERARPAERVAIAKDALDKEPNSAAAWWLLYDSLCATDKEQAVDTLRRASAAGMPHFFSQLVRIHPESLNEEEMERVLVSDSLPRLVVAECVLARRSADEAADLFLALLEDAQEGRCPGPSPYDAIAFQLRLAQVNETRLVECFDAFAEWLGESGQERHLYGGNIAAMFALLEEVVSLPTGFPVLLRRQLARAILEGDPSSAATYMAKWCAPRQSISQDVKEQMHDHAPMLFANVRDTVWRGEPATKKGSLGLKLGVLALFVVIRMATCDRSPSTPSFQVDDSLGLGAVTPSVEPPPDGASRICASLGEGTEECRLAQVALLAATGESDRCLGAHRAYESLSALCKQRLQNRRCP